MVEVFGFVAPVGVVIAAGVVLRLSGAANEGWVDVLNRYGLYIGFPALIFLNLTEIDLEQVVERAPVFAFNAGMLLAVLGVTFVIVRSVGLDTEMGNTLVISSFFGNVAYLGYPVVTSAIPGSEAEVSIIIPIYTLVLFSVGVFILESSRENRHGLYRILGRIATNPLIVAIALGFLFLGVGIPVPAVLSGALSMIRDSASAVVLISLGIFLAHRIPLRRVWRPTLVIVVLRLALVPLLAYLGTGALGLADVRAVTVIEAAMPLAVTPFALSSMYPMNREVLVASIFVSTVLAGLTIPLFILLVR
ncbi:MAG: AEC family transporter [Spirochaetaceae bacterium]